MGIPFPATRGSSVTAGTPGIDALAVVSSDARAVATRRANTSFVPQLYLRCIARCRVSSVDTHRLRYFLCIAEEGSINRAASVLQIAQPALSRQVRLLEEDLGVILFRRTSRGVE